MDSIGEGGDASLSLCGPCTELGITAAFDYHFGALQNTDNEFMHAYFGLMCVAHGCWLSEQSDNAAGQTRWGHPQQRQFLSRQSCRSGT